MRDRAYVLLAARRRAFERLPRGRKRRVWRSAAGFIRRRRRNDRFLVRRGLRLELLFRQFHLGLKEKWAGNVFFARGPPWQAIAGRNGMEVRVGREPGYLEGHPRRIIGRILGNRSNDDRIDLENFASRRASSSRFNCSPKALTVASTRETGITV